jgi:diguanylate cyclase
MDANREVDLKDEDPDPQMSSDRLKQELEHLDGRDLHLWSMAILVAVILAAGFMAVVLPNFWPTEMVRVQARYLPTLLLGFIVLITLANIYLLDQRRQVKRARLQVFQQLLRAEAAERDARMDPLTECFNRRCLEPLLQKELKRAERLATKLSVIVIDVDNFRDVNTRYGHLTGDAILKAAVRILKETLRASDTVVRYGGDEFVLILPEATAAQAELAMGRVMKSVGVWNRRGEVPGYEISLSWGISEFESGFNGPEMIDRADQKMYEAKHSKRVPVV